MCWIENHWGTKIQEFETEKEALDGLKDLCSMNNKETYYLYVDGKLVKVARIV